MHGVVPPEKLLNTHRFSMERAESAVGWVRELNGEHTPETEEYGIASFVYRARRPFHPERLNALLDEQFPAVLRAKGFLWLATCHDDVVLFSIAGSTVSLEPQAQWLAAGDEPDEDDAETWEYRDKVWQEPHGDRRQELVFIGIGMDRAALEERLNTALLSPEEFRAGPRVWAGYTDPFHEMFRDALLPEEVAA